MRLVANKLAKTAVLRRKRVIAMHIPATGLYSDSQLSRMLSRYRIVVAKPVTGTGGKGVYVIARRRQGYTLKRGSTVSAYRSFSALCNALKRLRGGRAYLLQRWIPLARIGNRPVDYRIKYVKQQGRWKLRAFVGRAAKRGLMVTNICRGGELLKGRAAVRRSLPHVNSRLKRKQMLRLALRGIRALEAAYPGIGQLGFDIGLDRSGRIWLLEVNTKPS